jgi:hypothetical protein
MNYSIKDVLKFSVGLSLGMTMLLSFKHELQPLTVDYSEVIVTIDQVQHITGRRKASRSEVIAYSALGGFFWPVLLAHGTGQTLGELINWVKDKWTAKTKKNRLE